MLESIFSYLT